jgi:hypothetical protein
MDYLADGLGILGFALLLAKFIAAWHERKRIYGEPPGHGRNTSASSSGFHWLPR